MKIVRTAFHIWRAFDSNQKFESKVKFQHFVWINFHSASVEIRFVERFEIFKLHIEAVDRIIEGCESKYNVHAMWRMKKMQMGMYTLYTIVASFGNWHKICIRKKFELTKPKISNSKPNSRVCSKFGKLNFASSLDPV